MRILVLILLVFVIFDSSAKGAFAYIDPGSIGQIYQYGYILFYGAITALLFLFKPFLSFLAHVKKKLFLRTAIPKVVSNDAGSGPTVEILKNDIHSPPNVSFSGNDSQDQNERNT